MRRNWYRLVPRHACGLYAAGASFTWRLRGQSPDSLVVDSLARSLAKKQVCLSRSLHSEYKQGNRYYCNCDNLTKTFAVALAYFDAAVA